MVLPLTSNSRLRAVSNIPSVQLLLVGGIAAVVAAQASSNWGLWAACLFAFPIAVWILGGKRAHAIMIFMVAISWLQVVGDVLAADMAGDALSQGSVGRYRVAAIGMSLAGILALAIGMRLGAGLSRPPGHQSNGIPSQPNADRAANPDRVAIAYVLSLVVVQILEIVARSVPALTQPILAFATLKFVFMYLLATTVFESGRGQHWLAVILGLELVTGIFSYLGTYQNAIFIVLIALAASRGRVSLPVVLFGLVCAVIIVWMSMVWSVVKIEYRSQFDRPLGERIDWMVKRLFVDPIDYGAAASRLAHRLGYTELFAVVIARDDVGLLPRESHLYSSAVLHVFMPRILFPDKAVLNDSKITTELTGMSIREGTSVGVGYVAEAFADFGFPGMLIPLAMFGLALGGAARYFMSRPVPWSVRLACATSAIFFTCRFETDIDKAFGAFVTALLAMVLALKYGYPMIEDWLTKSAVISRSGTGRSFRSSNRQRLGARAWPGDGRKT
jgi:hypothetical protein